MVDPLETPVTVEPAAPNAAVDVDGLADVGVDPDEILKQNNPALTDASLTVDPAYVRDSGSPYTPPPANTPYSAQENDDDAITAEADEEQEEEAESEAVVADPADNDVDTTSDTTTSATESDT